MKYNVLTTKTTRFVGETMMAPDGHIKFKGHIECCKAKNCTDGKITRNTHVKDESHTSYGSNVMIKIKVVLSHTDIQAKN